MKEKICVEKKKESAVMKILGIFDKVDDIIYVPLNLACDWLRQPLKQLENSNDLKKMEYAQKLEKELKQFELDLDVQKKRQEMELSIDEKRSYVEIDNLIQEVAIQRQEEMMQLEMKYRTELAELNAKMTRVMSEMQAEAINALLTLVEEKKKSYLDIQKAYRKELTDTVKELQELGMDKETTNPILIDGLKKITEESNTFNKMLVDCVERASEIITKEAERSSQRMNDYFRTRQNENSILSKDRVTIEEKRY